MRCLLNLCHVQVGIVWPIERAALLKVVDFPREFLKSVGDFSELNSQPWRDYYLALLTTARCSREKDQNMFCWREFEVRDATSTENNTAMTIVTMKVFGPT